MSTHAASHHHTPESPAKTGCPSTLSGTASLWALVTVMAPLAVLFAMLVPKESTPAAAASPDTPSCHWQRSGYHPEPTEYPLESVGTGDNAWQVWCPVACDPSLNPDAPACAVPPEPAH